MYGRLPGSRVSCTYISHSALNLRKKAPNRAQVHQDAHHLDDACTSGGIWLGFVAAETDEEVSGLDLLRQPATLALVPYLNDLRSSPPRFFTAQFSDGLSTLSITRICSGP